MTNPVFKVEEHNAEKEASTNARDVVIDASQVMTVNGTLQITLFMGIILVIAAAVVWQKFAMGYTDIGNLLMSVGGIAGFIIALIICFARTTVLVPIYAAFEGMLLGGLSAIFENSYPGIVVQATAGTFAALFSMLILYRAGVIKCTDKFRSVIFISTASVAGIYIIDIIGRFFGYAIPVINTSSIGGIIFSLVVILIAAFNLIVDFDFIEQGAQRMYPKKYEWIGAFGLMVTLVWLYVEILKILAKLNSRD